MANLASRALAAACHFSVKKRINDHLDVGRRLGQYPADHEANETPMKPKTSNSAQTP